MNKIDLIILGIILIFMLVGYRRGLVKVAVSLVQYIIVLICSIFLTPILSGFLINNFNIDSVILNFIIQNKEKISGIFAIISDEILQNIVARIINVFTFIILFIVLKLVLYFVMLMLNKIANLPILSMVNRVGGLGLGAIEGILLIYATMIIINWLPITVNTSFNKAISDSFLCSTIMYCVPELATEVINMVKLTN